MKKESKGRYKVSEQLSDKTSALIMIASGISVLLLMIYFGMSLTSKGTFSADTLTDGNYIYSCSSGVIQNIGSVYKCCPTDYPNLGAVTEGNSLYGLNDGGYLCKNNNYVANANNFISTEGTIGYCLASIDFTNPQTGAVECTSNGGIVNGTSCFFECAASPLGNADYTIAEHTCESSQYGITINTGSSVVNLTKTTGCVCPTGWTKDSSTQCHTVWAHNDSTHSSGYSAGGMDFLCKNGYVYSAPDGYCRKCDDGYDEVTGSNGQVSCANSETGETDPTCAWGSVNSQGKCEVHCAAGIPGLVGSPSKSSCEAVYRGYTCTEVTANTLYSCVGNKPSCSVSIGDCNLQADSNGQRVDADIYVTSPVSYTYQWEFSGDGYKSGAPTIVSQPQNEFTAISANPYYSYALQSLYNINTNPSGNISAKITIKLSTGASCTYTKNISLTPCTDCGGGSDDNIVKRCIKHADEEVIIDRSVCDELEPGTNCDDNPTENANKYCTIIRSVNGNSSGRVRRCDLALPGDASCAKTTETIRCYYCDGTRRSSYDSTTGACDNSSYPTATTDSNLDCSTSSVTCYKCVANSTVASSDTFTGDSCPSGWSTTRPTCSKSCNYCEDNTKKTDNNVPKEKACSAYNSNYHETSEALDCSGQKKTCYKCNSETVIPDTQQVDQNASCPSGWSATRPTCSKSCNYCENNTKKTDDNVPKGKTCSAYNSNYHETSEALDCSPAKTTCYYCEGTSRKSFTLETSANGNCANSTAHPGATNNSNLKCVEEVKCCACDGTNKVTKDDSTNGKCPSGQTICGELVCTNVQTGSTAIVIAWIVGIMAIGYSFYYFRKTNKQQ